jgi:hypothetical protein
MRELARLTRKWNRMRELVRSTTLPPGGFELCTYPTRTCTTVTSSLSSQRETFSCIPETSQYHWSRYFKGMDHEHILQEVNTFFSKVPFKHKIFVAGNHDLGLDKTSHNQTTLQALLPNAFYLQDSFVTLVGITFYGCPWTNIRTWSLARAFSRKQPSLDRHWEAIPSGTDVVITHLPPHGLMDIGKTVQTILKDFWNRRTRSPEDKCTDCGIYVDEHPTCRTTHPNRSHWGCRRLREEMLMRVR